MASYGVSQESINRLLALLNTRPHVEQGDLLDDTRGGNVPMELGITPAIDTKDLPRLRRIRDALVSTIAGTATGWDEVSEVAAELPLVRTFGRDERVRLSTQAPSGATTALILDTVAALLASRQWGRVKVCQYDGCSLAFFDTTRNRSQVWDSYATCGNRANVAAHRARNTPRP